MFYQMSDEKAKNWAKEMKDDVEMTEKEWAQFELKNKWKDKINKAVWGS